MSDTTTTTPRMLDRIRSRFGDRIIETHEHRGDCTVQLEREALLEVGRFLREDQELLFDLLLDITAVDYIGSTPRFEVVYHLYSVARNHRVRLKARVPEDDARIASVAPIWCGANWLERETYDMYGIVFDGHPDLRRIYLYEEFQGHPLRKDYPKERRQPLVRREELDEPQARRQVERERERYGRWQ